MLSRQSGTINRRAIDKESLVKVTNIQGQQIYSKTNNGSQIDVSNLNDGIYFLEVNDADVVYKKKFSIIK